MKIYRIGSNRKKRLAPERGLAAVEFALTIVCVMFVIFWAFELMMFVYNYSVLADAAKEGVRYAVVHGSGSACNPYTAACDTANITSVTPQVTTQVTNFARLTFHDISGMTVNVTYLDSSSASPNRVQVVVHYPYKPYFSFGWSPPTINAAAEGRIAY